MIERSRQLLREKKSFALETTLSGLAYLEFIKSAKLAGYHIVLFFIWLENFHLAKCRVAERVRKGGQNIPGDVIERRYKKGIENFSKYASQANDWYVYDNSGAKCLLIARSIEEVKEIFNFEIFNKVAG
jgi:predicted ABC-type ATPase